MAANNQLTPVNKLKGLLNVDSVQEQFKNALKDNAPLFVASLIDIYSTDKYLQDCEPAKVIAEALKAATLKLPINKALGFAYIVAYKKVPTFIPGYKGYIQLAMRTGMYKYLNADVVYEGEYKGRDKLTGKVDLTGEPKSDKIVGYFCHMEMLNGFNKTYYRTKEEIIAHAKKYSQSYGRDSSAWSTSFDSMALKTVVRYLLSHYGYLSVEMINVMDADLKNDPEDAVQSEITMNANSQTIDVEVDISQDVPVGMEIPIELEPEGAQQFADGPDF